MLSDKDLARLLKLIDMPLNEEGDPEYSRCFEWTGARTGEYGVFRLNNKHAKPHRLLYDYVWGDLQPNQDVHHECKNKLCMNPFHLYAVDHAAHTSEHSKDRVRKMYCIHGHLMTEENTYKYTQDGSEKHACKECRDKAWRRSRYWREYLG